MITDLIPDQITDRLFNVSINLFPDMILNVQLIIITHTCTDITRGQAHGIMHGLIKWYHSILTLKWKFSRLVICSTPDMTPGPIKGIITDLIINMIIDILANHIPDMNPDIIQDIDTGLTNGFIPAKIHYCITIHL